METPEFLQEEHTSTRTRLSPGSIVLLIGVVAVVIVVALQLFDANQSQPTSGIAPDFALDLYGGGTFQLSEQVGKVVVINFWGSWCGPCRDEAPDLQMLWEEYQDDDVIFVGVNRLDIESEALEFIDEFGITYVNGNDTGEKISRQYNVEGAPESFVIGQDGQVARFIYGPIRVDALQQTINTLLAEPGSDA